GSKLGYDYAERRITAPKEQWVRVPYTVRSSEAGAHAQPEGGFARIVAILPPLKGGLLLRAFQFLERRTYMNHNVLIIIVAVIVGSVILAALLKEFRHAFLVPEGYAGLLYHKGKFAEVLGAGRHIRWGRHFTLDAQDVRKASLLVAGQEVLTADNVGLKLSL